MCKEVGGQRSGILGVCEELVIVLAFLQRQDNLSMRVGTKVSCWRGGGAGSGTGHRSQDMVQESLALPDDGQETLLKSAKLERLRRCGEVPSLGAINS